MSKNMTLQSRQGSH